MVAFFMQSFESTSPFTVATIARQLWRHQCWDYLESFPVAANRSTEIKCDSIVVDE